MTYDPAQATALIAEHDREIDRLRRAHATEHELADQLHFCLQTLMKDYVRGELDPRTDDTITNTLALYRETRNYNLND